jgi:hypothetical protein
LLRKKRHIWLFFKKSNLRKKTGCEIEVCEGVLKREEQVVKKKLVKMALKIRGARKGQRRQPTTEALMTEMRNIQECLQTIEMAQRRGVEVGDMSDEEEPQEDMEVQEERKSAEEMLIKEIMKVSSKPQLEVHVYEVLM